MKIAILSDSHVFYGNQRKSVFDMMEKIRAEKPDVVCNLGDFGEVLIEDDLSLVDELFSFNPTVFLVGNHDLYNKEGTLTPPKAMEECLKKMRWGVPLQKSWTDTTTYFEKDDCLFLGSILFPDFAAPKLIMPTRYYDNGCPTIDGTFMNLRGGWLQYTNPLLESFEKKLQLVDKTNCKNIIVLTHYSCYLSQYKFDPNSDISPYFYCFRAGLMIKAMAEKHPDKNFFVLSGHGHEYMIGALLKETDNIWTYGFIGEYGRQKYMMFDSSDLK